MRVSIGGACSILRWQPRLRQNDSRASFKKVLFGARSEKIDPGQYELELEDIETAIAQVEADERTAPVRTPNQPHQTNRESLPKHLERVKVIIEPELSCGCGAERHVIGADVSERLDIIAADMAGKPPFSKHDPLR